MEHSSDAKETFQSNPQFPHLKDVVSPIENSDLDKRTMLPYKI